MKDRHLVLSIDPGKNNGIVLWCEDKQEYIKLKVMKVYEVFQLIDIIKDEIRLVLLEDANKNWNPSGGREGEKGRAQGAGWIKGLCDVYVEYFESLEFLETNGQVNEDCGEYQLIKSDRAWTKKDTQYVYNHTGEWIEGAKSHPNQNLRDALMMFRFYGF